MGLAGGAVSGSTSRSGVFLHMAMAAGDSGSLKLATLSLLASSVPALFAAFLGSTTPIGIPGGAGDGKNILGFDQRPIREHPGQLSCVDIIVRRPVERLVG